MVNFVQLYALGSSLFHSLFRPLLLAPHSHSRSCSNSFVAFGDLFPCLFISILKCSVFPTFYFCQMYSILSGFICLVSFISLCSCVLLGVCFGLFQKTVERFHSGSCHDILPFLLGLPSSICFSYTDNIF